MLDLETLKSVFSSGILGSNVCPQYLNKNSQREIYSPSVYISSLLRKVTVCNQPNVRRYCVYYGTDDRLLKGSLFLGLNDPCLDVLTVVYQPSFDPQTSIPECLGDRQNRPRSIYR